MISTSCPNCEKSYKLDDKFVGKKVRCKVCDKFFVVAEPSELDEIFAMPDAPAAPKRAKPAKAVPAQSEESPVQSAESSAETPTESFDETEEFLSEGEAIPETVLPRKRRGSKKASKANIHQLPESTGISAASPLRVIGAGTLAGAAGALVWGAIAYFAHLEVGFVAWGVGALVGVSVRATAGQMKDGLAGAIAAVLSVISILAGKFLAAIFVANWLIAEGKIPGNVPPELYWTIVSFAFQQSFGVMDSIFFILSVVVAYRLGSSAEVV